MNKVKTPKEQFQEMYDYMINYLDGAKLVYFHVEREVGIPEFDSWKVPNSCIKGYRETATETLTFTFKINREDVF